MRFDPPSQENLNRATNLVVSTCRTVFAENLVCVTLKGSAVKGDFIPGYSDFDFHVFLKPKAMDGERAPKVKDALLFQESFGDINPEDYGVSQFQIYFINSERYPTDWAPSIKGTYRILWGDLPLSAREAHESIYLQLSKKFLSTIGEDRIKIVERFVDKPNTRAPTIIRLLGATIKSHMYSVAILLLLKPKTALYLKLDETIRLVEKGIKSKGHISAFFEHVSNWNRIQQNPNYAREAFSEGIKALDEIAHWAEK